MDSLPPVDVSIEQVAALSSQNTLPEPTLELDKLQGTTTTSTFVSPPTTLRRETIRPTPGYSDDPWSINRYATLPPGGPQTAFGGGASSGGAPAGTGSSLAGTGLPDFWWQRQESVKVTLLGHQGFILNRYVVYEVSSEVSVTLLCKSLA